MPRTSDGRIALVALILFAAWLFIALPLIYLPSGGHTRGELLDVKYGEWLIFSATVVLAWTTWMLVKSAERTAKQQLRGYVTVQTVDVKMHRLPSRMGAYGGFVEGPVHTYRLSIILKNGGATPAINGRINISHGYFGTDIGADFSFPDSTNFGNALIGPQVVWHTPPILIPANELEKPNGFHYLWGWIEYDDVFSGTPRRRTEFCFLIDRERLQPTNEFWAGFTPHSRFNAADEDCLRQPSRRP